MKRYMVVLVAAFAAIVAMVAPSAATPKESEDPPSLSADGRYVVLLEEEPLVAEFGTEGLNTAPAKNKGQEMKAKQKELRSQTGVAEADVTYNYTVALNGFAAELNDAQVAKLKASADVMTVLPDVIREKQTDSSPEFLGLNAAQGPWQKGVDGEGVIVGIIDSGIWPEHPSFADDGSYKDLGLELDETNYPACDFGNKADNPADEPFECNNKLIGARQVIPTYRSVIGTLTGEFNSARDADGHGTHTASTAAGNADVDATVLGHDVGTISGIAPRARVIAYKGLGSLGGFGSDLAASIDQAVADGVDVINYSIGSSSYAIGPDDIAFLFAADAGVHVATSNGNSGPNPATTGSPASVPWLTSVGASTQSRFFQGTITLGNGETYTGASLTQSLPMTDLVDAEFAGIDGANGELCIVGGLDPAVVEGKVVLCKRGLTARASKSQAVLEAGGVGMILYNAVDVDNLFTDSHFVPSVHIDYTPGLAIKDYIATDANPTAAIDTVQITEWPNAPTMTIFSSRGPNRLSGDIIKPDITAPGFQIVAGYSPASIDGIPGEMFASIAGTSMSSPHIAGIMALIDQEHPDWSPAAVKSALMTTAHQDVLDNDRTTPADPFDMGSGHVAVGAPNKAGSAFQPGLVYDAGFLDYLGFLCDADPALLSSATCANLAAAGVPTKAYNLNYPSIAVAELPGSQVVTRTVTSVANEKGFRTYEVSVDAPEGFKVEVNPPTLRLKSGQSATYQVRITNESAPIGEWRHGSLTWSSKGYEVRSPISVKGSKLLTPDAVTGTGVDGSASFDVSFGYTGDYTAAAHGLEPATVFSGTVTQDPDQTFTPSDVGNGAVLHEVTASGAALLRIAMPPDAVDDPNADIDLFVFGPGGRLVATSTNGATDELIDLVLPADGTYQIYVHGWQAPGSGVNYDLYTWLVSATPGGNLSIDSAPTSATIGGVGTVDVSWTGATAGEWHLGAVSHADASGLMALTLVDVDNR